MAAAVACALTATPAGALTEARIVDVSCHGLRIVQTGLPKSVRFDVEAINAADGDVLAEREVRSTPHGRLDVSFRVDLHAVRRLHGEVGKSGSEDSEYGEADVTLDRTCHVTGAGRPHDPGIVSPTSSPSAATPKADDSSTSWWVGGLAAVAAAAFLALAVRRSRRRS